MVIFWGVLIRDWWLTWNWLTFKRHLIQLTTIYYRKNWEQLVSPNHTIDCFKSYRSNRLLRVNLENCYSDPSNITCGVPQGSILGPLLFFMYVNDILQAVKSNLFLYVDDSCFIFQAKNVIEIEKQLNRDFTNICEWFVT